MNDLSHPFLYVWTLRVLGTDLALLLKEMVHGDVVLLKRKGKKRPVFEYYLKH